jgi:hypothetical protein
MTTLAVSENEEEKRNSQLLLLETRPRLATLD